MPKPNRIELNIVRLTADLAAHVDAWAAAHAVDRTAAIQRLVELGLKAEADIAGVARHRRDDLAIEVLAATQIGLLIDPETPEEERERRIQRLTEGPPEFVNFRIDLPGRSAHQRWRLKNSIGRQRFLTTRSAPRPFRHRNA